MVAENTKRYICCFLATIILFLGMCLNVMETDSYFLYNHTVSTGDQISAVDVIIDDEIPCTSEMLGRNRSVQFRGQYRTILLSLFVGIVLQCLFLLQGIEQYEFAELVHSDAVTIAYIHRKDGEK